MKTFILIALLGISLVCKAQKMMIINIVDSIGYRDSVIIGTDVAASRGIDFHLGELDISGTSPTGTDIRSVMQPSMCIIDSLAWFQNHIYETKVDLRDSMVGIYGTSPIPFFQNRRIPLNDMSKNSFYIRFQCGVPPCRVYYNQKWPFDFIMADRFWVAYYPADANGYLQCNSSSSSVITNASPITIVNNYRNRNPIYINYIYFNPTSNSIPKSLAAAGLQIKEGYLVNESEYHSPTKVEIIDPLGRNLLQANWPEENRLLLPQHLHGVLLLRLWYGNGQVAVVRHGF
jgi:hypothetical protein